MQQYVSLLLLIQIISILWLVGMSFVVFKAISMYKTFTAGISKEDLASALVDLRKHGKNTDMSLEVLQKKLLEVNKRLETHIQKLGFVRYNPFGNTGGDQSFCLCLLDEQDNGILLTSLHTREQTRLYTKEITHGLPADQTPLSKEEQQCIKKAKMWSR